MIVTKFQYPLERNLIKKYDLMIKRLIGSGAKRDVVIGFEGGEGEGKTTFSIASAIYFAEKTGRKFDHNNVFFDVNKMIEFAVNTKEQIMVYDEPALQSLSTDWASSEVKNLTRLLMMARKKQHVIFINMTKFYKFNEYIVVDRSLALIHVYSRKNIYSGHFQYIRKKYLESLWRDYRFSKRRNYKKYASKSVRGTFPDVLNPKYKNNVCSGFNVNEYERMKDEAIQQIGKETKKDKKRDLVANLIRNKLKRGEKLDTKQLAEDFDYSMRSIQEIAKEIRENEVCETKLNNTMGIPKDTLPTEPEETEKNDND